MTMYEPRSAAELRAHYQQTKRRLKSLGGPLDPETLLVRGGQPQPVPAKACLLTKSCPPAVAPASPQHCVSPRKLPGRRGITIDSIIHATQLASGFTRDELLSHRHFKDLCFARHCAMYLCKKLTGATLPKIGREFAQRDHTTILHGVGKVEAELTAGHAARAEMLAAIRARLEELLVGDEPPIWS